MSPAMKPDDIPEDVWEAAEATQDRAIERCKAARFAVSDYPFASGAAKYVLDDEIARAIMAERGRCAKIAEGFEQTRDWVPGSLYDALRREVAAAIRQKR